MANTKFYFYSIKAKDEEDNPFDWLNSLDVIYNETQSKKNEYQEHQDYSLGIYVLQKEKIGEETLYKGYMIVGEDQKSYKKEKKGEFLELDFQEDEHLCHVVKGRLYFLFWIDNEGRVILMLEKQYFSLNIKGFLSYFKSRYPKEAKKITSKTILGKDLLATLKNLRDNKVRLARIYFRKATPEETIKKYGLVEEEIASMLKKGIHAELYLHLDRPMTLGDFFKQFFKRKSFEEALDVDFGEFLRELSFQTDNDIFPEFNVLDKLVSLTLPLEKTSYEENQILSEMQNFFITKKEKIIGDV